MGKSLISLNLVPANKRVVFHSWCHFFQLKLSEDVLEGLRGEVYDLGTITEVLEGILSETDKQIPITLPSYDKVSPAC